MNLQIKQQEDTEQETYGGKCPISQSCKFCYVHENKNCKEERSPGMQEIGVRSPVRTDSSHKNKYWKLHCQTLSNRCESHWSLGVDHYKELAPVTVGVVC